MEVHLEQFAQAAAVAQPAIGGPFGAGGRHAGDDGAERRGALRTAQTQPRQQWDQLHLLYGPQSELFDADRAWSQQLERGEVDVVEVTFAGLAVVLLGCRCGKRHAGGEQLRGDTLRFLFDLGANIGAQQRILGTQLLFDTTAQQRPIGLRQREPAAEIEQGTLADAGAAAFGAHQAVGEVALAVGGGAGLSAAHEHG